MTAIHSSLYNTTTSNETLEPHMYIDSYKDTKAKGLIHTYKFTKDKNSPEFIHARQILVSKTIDICIETCISNTSTCHIFTSPPSTMFERGEKDVDSMFELLQRTIRYINRLVYNPNISISKIFTVTREHLVKHRAQHIGVSRKARTNNLQYRYLISFQFKLKLWFFLHIRKIKNFSCIIVDDVSSTGSTLVACKFTLLTYLKRVQKKNPHIKFDVKIFSLCH